jgi:hypothetical protein
VPVERRRVEELGLVGVGITACGRDGRELNFGPTFGVGQQPGEMVARGVHRSLAGERVRDVAYSASPGLAPSASLSRVQTFMLMTIPMISRISSCE